MISTINTLFYKGFGLNISSEYSLPELTPITHRVKGIDVFIEIGDLSKRWLEMAGESTKRFVVKDSVVMFEVPNTAIFSIKDGKKITVSPMLGAEEDKVRLYILGTCMGALLIQRKTIPLHGSAVAIDGRAYAFVGDSGAGKSTLAAAFIKEGYHLLSDDVIPVILSEDKIPFVIPTYPQQKLWQESLSQFGMSTSTLKPLFDRETKYTVPVDSGFIKESLPLAGIFELVKGENNQVYIRKIEGLERFHILYMQTYRNFLVARLDMMEWHFNESAKILNRVKMFQLHRPISEFTAPTLVSIILSAIKEERKL